VVAVSFTFGLRGKERLVACQLMPALSHPARLGTKPEACYIMGDAFVS
jgi:hypothetical protein